MILFFNYIEDINMNIDEIAFNKLNVDYYGNYKLFHQKHDIYYDVSLFIQDILKHYEKGYQAYKDPEKAKKF